MSLIDTHAHLDQLENLDEALKSARQAGVEAVGAVSMNLASCRRNLEIKRTFTQPKIYLAMGIHPAEADKEELEPCLKFIREHKDEVSAIGEIGLDFWYKWARKDEEKKRAQRESFLALLDLAREHNVPAIIHSRGTWRECLDTAKNAGVARAVSHWYSGPLDVLEGIIAAGYIISASPALATSAQSREAALRVPIERLLLETDCPVVYKMPDSEEEIHSEPKDVSRTLKYYCQLKGLEEEKVVDIFNRNAKIFFEKK